MDGRCKRPGKMGRRQEANEWIRTRAIRIRVRAQPIPFRHWASVANECCKKGSYQGTGFSPCTVKSLSNVNWLCCKRIL